MDPIEKAITTLLRSAITGESLPLPEDFLLENAMALIKSHGIATLVYEGALRCGINRQEPEMQQLFRIYCRQMLQSEGQVREIQRICSRFEEEHIDYMPLKGSKMKWLYPRPELRLMGDADILIRKEQYSDIIVPTLLDMGFQFQEETDHEIVWKSSNLFLELHKRLIPSNNDKFNRYFQNVWDFAVKEKGYCYSMPLETEFLYLFTHFTKHYRGGGIGCRHVVDLWVYRRKNPDMDEERIFQELKKLGLDEFYENIIHMMEVWFASASGDDKTEFLTNYIFSSGSWGRAEQHTLIRGVQWQNDSSNAARSRIRYFFAILFPGKNALMRQYQILKHAPWLLPFVWIFRLFEKCFTGIKWNDHRKVMTLYTRENLDYQRSMLEFVGIKELR